MILIKNIFWAVGVVVISVGVGLLVITTIDGIVFWIKKIWRKKGK